MSPRSLTTPALMLALTFGMTGMLRAQEEASEDREVIKPKAEKYRPANSIDFAYELGLSFDSLSKLGDQIESSRDSADPVGLASAAALLEASEKVAGKKASMTAADLQKEAVELAKRRSVPAELKTLASLTGDDSLKELALAATEQDEQRRKQEEAGVATKDLHGDLHVHNHSHEGFWIYANGRRLGYVPPHGERTWHLHGIHYVDAKNRYHRLHRHIEGHKHHYDFYIHVHH